MQQRVNRYLGPLKPHGKFKKKFFTLSMEDLHKRLTFDVYIPCGNLMIGFIFVIFYNLQNVTANHTLNHSHKNILHFPLLFIFCTFFR